MDNKICKFCGEIAPYTPLPSVEQHQIKIHFCKDCNAEYLSYDDLTTISISLYVEINNKMYRFTSSWSGNILWLIKEPGIPGFQRNKDFQIIQKLGKDDLGITPKNIKDKVQTWLTFL